MKRMTTVVLLAAALAIRLPAQAQPAALAQADPFARFLFPPELVMQHQGEIQLQEAQREALQAAIQEAQSTVLKMQFAMSAEGEKLTRLLDMPKVDEKEVLAQIDRILGIEREVKRAQVTLMVRIKNTLTPAQQARLRELRAK